MLCYVFCAVEGQATALPAVGMPGGAAPRAVPLDDTVALIVSDVPSVTYNAETLEPKLSDLDWVGEAGAAHHAVVDALAEAGLVVVPFRLFTIFSTEDKALATFRDARAALAGVFDRVRGRQEWVLRIGKPDPARIEAPAPEASRASGKSFLQAKSGARRESAARSERVRADAAAAYESLAALAQAASSRPVDPNGTLLLDAAFLAEPARVEEMRRTLTRAADRLLKDGCSVSLTGPWPPYSFASMELVRHG